MRVFRQGPISGRTGNIHERPGLPGGQALP